MPASQGSICDCETRWCMLPLVYYVEVCRLSVPHVLPQDQEEYPDQTACQSQGAGVFAEAVAATLVTTARGGFLKALLSSRVVVVSLVMMLIAVFVVVAL